MGHHSRHKQRSASSSNEAYVKRSRQAENDAARLVSQNRNQKGHIPNSPSTG